MMSEAQAWLKDRFPDQKDWPDLLTAAGRKQYNAQAVKGDRDYCTGAYARSWLLFFSLPSRSLSPPLHMYDMACWSTSLLAP
jgi:hypothetical protein